MINIFIVGSKGIPAKYGGFETFVEKLTFYKKDEKIKYFVSCMGEQKVFEHNGATCFSIELTKNSAVSRMINVSKSLTWVEKYLKQNKNNAKNFVYILGCRVGLLIKKHARVLHKLGCTIVANPDGLEWKRDKWSGWQKKILLLSEKKLIKYSDYLICDSIGIQEYIKEKYKQFPADNIKYIAYGSEISESSTNNVEAEKWLKQFECKPFDYYLVVGRFVAENNFALMIKEFMKSKTNKKLLIISNVENNKLYQSLVEEYHFEKDRRIVFAGTLYDEQMLQKIRELAFAYLHGHSVGGTNPSLLEALSYTKVNILYDVSFNKEVGLDQCLYFSKKEGDLSSIIDSLDNNDKYSNICASFNSKEIIRKRYSWDFIVDEYEGFFNQN